MAVKLVANQKTILAFLATVYCKCTDHKCENRKTLTNDEDKIDMNNKEDI